MYYIPYHGLGKLLRRIIPEKLRPLGYLTHLTREKTSNCVRQGPFAGMRYIATSIGSAYIPKLLGIYEKELNPFVEAICAKKPALIVDVGAAEGYYAIGLARKSPYTRVIGYEMETNGQEAMNQMAVLNDVADRVSVRGKCEPSDLEEVIEKEPHPVVICDVEGYEQYLLDQTAVPSLRRAVILVELHDFLVPNITEELQRRFFSTHRIVHIWQEPRSRAEFPWRTWGTRLLPKSYLDWTVSEWRPVKMAWLYMEPKE